MRGWIASFLIVAACGGEGAPDLDAADAPPPDAIDATQVPACAEPGALLPIETSAQMIALAIAADGTTYFAHTSPAGRIARATPGAQQAEQNWMTLPGDRAIFRLAIDPATGMLYAGSTNGLWQIDPATRSPLNYDAVQVRALAFGPDGALYYTSGQDGHNVFRSTAPGQRTQVTANGFAEPSDLLFDGDGSLLVDDLVTATVWRVSLDGGHVEAGRGPALAVVNERPIAIARDTEGRHYVTFLLRGLERYDASFANPEVLDADADGGDLAFARGFLGCDDLYVAMSSGLARRVTVGVTGTP